ncbi:hypothetical protein AB0I81_29615 [Nonomuraea sp. NPDC050404]|uniref:hypothetical protein n=1 Tax=Nonomuraea sp. NPDC050404 TaxID=3155783 RepID=UPI0033D5EF1A
MRSTPPSISGPVGPGLVSSGGESPDSVRSSSALSRTRAAGIGGHRQALVIGPQQQREPS